jgi:hypothetical protein
LIVPAVLAQPAHAGILFNKHPKQNPATRVPTLITILRTDLDDGKRASAAVELRSFDANAFPEIVPALVDSALRDPKTGVRLEAVQSLAKLRPISQQAGSTLEQIVDNDPSLRVRFQARSSLVQYHLSGYRVSKSHELPPTGVKTDEPPLASPVPQPTEPAPAISAAEPARLVPSPARSAPQIVRPVGARPMPVGPPVASSPAPAADGPELAPPGK